MAGTKRPRNGSNPKVAKVSKIENKKEHDLHSMTPGDKSKQKKGNVKTQSRKTVARIFEDNQILEIETQDQMTDFLSENEMGEDMAESESEAGKECNLKMNRSGKVRRFRVDQKISFRCQQNNNAIIADTDEEVDKQNS